MCLDPKRVVSQRKSRLWKEVKSIEQNSGHLSGKHSVPIDHPHLHLPALCSNQVGGVTRSSHIFKFTTFFKPAHWLNSCQVIIRSNNCSIISGAYRDCWNVDVTVNEGAGAILEEEFDMQGHPYLGDGEGGAGVLLAVAGSLMEE